MTITSNLTVQQLHAVTDADESESHLYGALGAVFYEIAPGAPFLSRNQIGMILREAAQNHTNGRSPDVTIHAHNDGSASYSIDYPGSEEN